MAGPASQEGGKRRESTYDLPMAATEVQESTRRDVKARWRGTIRAMVQAGRREEEVGAAKRVRGGGVT
jgi:hypothetical protein